jgi:hypothetical protein
MSSRDHRSWARSAGVAIALAAGVLLCAGVTAAGQRREATAAKGTATEPGVRTGTIHRDSAGEPILVSPRGTRVSCHADRGSLFDCSAADSKGRHLEHANEVWMARIERGRSLTVTAIGRRLSRGAAIPGARLDELARVAQLVAKAEAEAEARRQQMDAAIEAAIPQTVVCEMCNWGGECWEVPCVLPPDKD